MKLIIILLLLIHKTHCDVHCNNPVADLRITSTHQSESYHVRSKRAAQNIRITRYYDDSYNSLSNKDQITSLVLDPAIQYWQNTLIVKNPLTTPLIIDKECSGTFSYITSGSNRLKVCTTSCVASKLCYTTPIPNQFLQQCYTKNSNGGYTATGSAGEGASNTDLLLIITQKTVNCGSSVLAYATVCELEYTLDRPVIGLINICPGSINIGVGLKMSIATLKHEIAHVLGLSSNLYAFYRNQSGSPLTPRDTSGLPNLGLKTIGTSKIYQYSDVTVKDYVKTFNYPTGSISRNVSYIVTPTIKSEIQTYYNCSSLEGMMLEDYGGSGSALSHFEKLYLQNDLMTASISINAQVSRMTIAVLQDSGWYYGNLDNAENFTYAKGLGCDLVSQSCYDYMKTKQSSSQPFSPYCNQMFTTSGLSCSSDMKYQTYCNLIDNSYVASTIPDQFKYFVSKTLVSSDPFSDYCPIVKIYARYISSNLIHTGECADPQNAVGQCTSNDFFNQGFGINSICITFSGLWYNEYSGSKVTPTPQGAGCYQYQRSSSNSLLIIVNNVTYQCQSKDQVIDVTSRNADFTAYGKLICPDCFSISGALLCNSATLTLNTQCKNADLPTTAYTSKFPEATRSAISLKIGIFQQMIFLSYFILMY